MTVVDRIEINPNVMVGKPIIRGTGIPVELILRMISEGASEADLLEAYPKGKRLAAPDRRDQGLPARGCQREKGHHGDLLGAWCEQSGSLWPLGLCRVYRDLPDRSRLQGQGRS